MSHPYSCPTLSDPTSLRSRNLSLHLETRVHGLSLSLSPSLPVSLSWSLFSLVLPPPCLSVSVPFPSKGSCFGRPYSPWKGVYEMSGSLASSLGRPTYWSPEGKWVGPRLRFLSCHRSRGHFYLGLTTDRRVWRPTGPGTSQSGHGGLLLL